MAPRANYRVLVLLGILAVAAWLRVHGLGAKSLWYNESDSACFLEFRAEEIVSRCGEPRAVHPPVYFLALKAWEALWGDSDSALRSLAAVCGVVTVAGVYLLARDLALWPGDGRPPWPLDVALLAAALVALSPLQIHLSRQVRGYSMATMLLAWGGWFLVRALRGGSHAGLFLAAAVTVDLAACCTHHVATLPVIAQGVFAFAFLWAHRHARGVPVCQALVAAAFFAVGYLAVGLPHLVRQSQTIRYDFDDPATWRGAAEHVTLTLVATAHTEMPPDLGSPWVAPLALAIIVGLAWRAGWGGRYVVVGGVMPVLLQAVFSLTSNRTLLAPRYLAFAQMFWLVSFAAVVGRARHGAARALLAVWAVGLSVYACAAAWPIIGPSAQPGMRAAVAFVLSRRAPGELVVASSADTGCGLRHYARSQIRPLILVDEPGREKQRGSEHLKDEYLVTPAALVARRPPGIWVLSGRSYFHDAVIFTPPYDWLLTESRVFDQDYYAEGSITVAHYKPREATVPAPVLDRDRPPSALR